MSHPLLPKNRNKTAAVVEVSNFPLTAFSDLRTAELHPQMQGSFEYTVLNTELNTIELTGAGTVTQADAMAVVSTSATAASTAIIHSRQHAKYRAGLGGLLRFTMRLTAPVQDTVQLVGLADEVGSSEAFKNGLMLGNVDALEFGFHRFSNDRVFTTPISAWLDPLDGSGPSGETISHTNLNVFFIGFEYLGAGPMFVFWQPADERAPVLVHFEKYANLFTEPSTHNPNYHFMMFADNKAATSDMIVRSSSYAYFIEGKTSFIELHQPHFSSGFQTATTVTTEAAIFTIRNKLIYAGKVNFIDAFLEHVVANIEANNANNLGSVRLIKNATLGGTPVYNDVHATNSIMEIDVAGTTVTGGTELFTVPLAGKNDKLIEILSGFKFLINPGDSVTVAGTSVNSSTMNGGLLWKELF